MRNRGTFCFQFPLTSLGSEEFVNNKLYVRHSVSHGRHLDPLDYLQYTPLNDFLMQIYLTTKRYLGVAIEHLLHKRCFVAGSFCCLDRGVVVAGGTTEPQVCLDHDN
jgi:hypothetical protein